MEPRVTWIMPVLNGMPYLPETLASIEAQTFKDFEVLIWDNGSTDGTVEVLREWIPRRLPGRAVIGRPLSYPKSLTELISLARSPLCARIDADDVNHPGRLAAQVAFLDANPEVVLVGTQVCKLSADGERGELFHELPTTHEEIVVRMLRYWAIWHPTVLYRREAVLAAGSYLDEYAVDDYSLWLRLARVGRLANLPEALVDYRVHDSSVTEREKKDGLLAEKITACIALHGPALFGLSNHVLRSVRSGERLAPVDWRVLWSHLRRNGARSWPLAKAMLRREVFSWVRRTIRRCSGRRSAQMAVEV
jgi:glycosyltransferase involved in cell wall biosynthesis